MNLEARLDGLVTTAELANRSDFALGGIIVSPSTRKILTADSAIDVEPRVMQVLVVLADAKGAVVTRDTLFRRCWGSSLATNESLNRAIGCLRKISSDLGENYFQVETITRTGYRLIVGDAASETEASSTISRRGVLVSGAAATVVAAGVFGFQRWQAPPLDPKVKDLVDRSNVALRSSTAPGDEHAIRLLEQAAELAPSNAPILGKLALARAIAAEHAQPANAASLVVKTQEAAQRALAIDRRDVDAMAALALLPPYYGDWYAAEQRMNAVLKVDYGHLPTRDARGFMLSGAGLAKKYSQDRIRIAAADPLHTGYQFKLVYAQWILGDIAGADRTADRALQLWPKHPAVWFAKLWLLAFTGRPERALAQLDDAIAAPQLPPGMMDVLKISMTALAGKRPADVGRARDGVIQMLSQGPSQSVNAVMILCGLKEIDRAFDVATAYLLERGPVMATVQWRPGQFSMTDQRRRKTNMLFLPLANEMQRDPRFDPLMKDIGLARYWEQAKVVPDYIADR